MGLMCRAVIIGVVEAAKATVVGEGHKLRPRKPICTRQMVGKRNERALPLGYAVPRP